MKQVQTKREIFSGYWPFILVASSTAVGLGNFWRFPYLVGEYGGSAFIFLYLVCVLLLGVPILIFELKIGRAGRANATRAMASYAKAGGANRAWGLLGLVGIVGAMFTLSSYSVVAAWAFDYTAKAFSDTFYHLSFAKAASIFTQVLSSPLQMTFWHSLVMLLTILIASGGIVRGLERWAKVLFPLLVMLLLILVVYALDSGAFMHGLVMVLSPNFAKLTISSFYAALGQAFFTLSIGSAIMMTYGSYMPDGVDVKRAALTIVAIDTGVSLLAGIAIFPLIFKTSLATSSGPGLVFQTMPIAFGDMPFSVFFVSVFFLLLSVAAITTAYGMLEPSITWTCETFGYSRRRASWLCGGIVWALGFMSIFSFNLLENYRFLGEEIYTAITNITDNILLPVTGLLLILFVGWFSQPSGMEDNHERSLLVRFVIPAAIIVVLLSSLSII